MPKNNRMPPVGRKRTSFKLRAVLILFWLGLLPNLL